MVEIEATNGSTTHNKCESFVMECARKSNRRMRLRTQKDWLLTGVAEAPLQKVNFII